MKKLLILIACSLFVFGCQEATSDARVSTIELSSEKLTFDYTAETQEITLSTNGNWELTNPCEWINVNPSSGTYGNDKEIEVTVYENASAEVLSYTLIFSSGGATDHILVEQAAYSNNE